MGNVPRGDGLQVGDVLFIDDLMDIFFLTRSHMGKISRQAFDIGGGRENTLSDIQEKNPLPLSVLEAGANP